jgi:hypothetical protein
VSRRDSQRARRLGEHDRAVFDELLVLERSRYGTWEIVADCPSATERDALVARFDGIDGEIEDWTESIRHLCAQCSLGEPHEHEREEESAWQRTRRIGLAAIDESALRRIRRLAVMWRPEIVSVERLR